MEQRRTITRSAFDVLEKARRNAELYQNSYVTPEHVLYQIESCGLLPNTYEDNGMSSFFFRERLGLFLSSLISAEPPSKNAVKISDNLRFAIEIAIDKAKEEGGESVGVPHLLFGLACQENSLAGFLLRKHPEVLQGFGVNSLN